MRGRRDSVLATPLSLDFWQKSLRPVVLRPHLSAGLPVNSTATMRASGVRSKGGFSSHEHERFGMLDRLGRTAYHDHVALLEYRIGAWLAPADFFTPYRAHGCLRAFGGEFRDALSHRPSMRRQDHAVKLFTKRVRVIEKFGSIGPKMLPQHAVAVTADVVHGADDPRDRQLQQQQQVG